MKRLRLLITACLAGCCFSCATIPPSYVAAERGTYHAIAPYYLEYVENDESLTEQQKAFYRDVVVEWRYRLDAAGK